MSDRIFAQVSWSHVLFERDGEWILTFMAGSGLVECDYSVTLTPVEINMCRHDPAEIEKLVTRLAHNTRLRTERQLKRSVWPALD